MRAAVDKFVFERFPDYRRGLVVGRGVTNALADPDLEERLRAAERGVVELLGGEDWRAHPRLAAWLAAFGQVGIPAGSKPPSVAALVKRVSKGASLPFINQLVALMNITSLENLLPCGGDDLHSVGPEIVLRAAAGTESYQPLGKPEGVEHPDPGELTLVDTLNGVVLCRCWCWRNSDVTKLTGDTTAVALNVDVMAPAVPFEEGEEITRRLADDILRHCGGEVGWQMLGREHPEMLFEL